MLQDNNDFILADQPTSEEWRDIPSFTGYQVSDLGRVRSFRDKSGWGIGESWHLIKAYPSRKGYLWVDLRNGSNNRFRRYVHRLVLETFVGPCPDGMEARHTLNNNRADNRLANLVWGTRLENSSDCLKHGTRVMGHDCHASKLTTDDITNLFKLRNDGMTLMALAKHFGVRYETVWKICNRKMWKGLPLEKPGIDRRRKNNDT